MQLTPEQQQMLEEQKKKCIFCQIIEGNIESKKVYEDDLLIGILDIHPATKGHVLLMPKEHYPIMPLIPKETFQHMFRKMKDVDRCVKEALLCKETTIFIANGAAAGQQSQHFMMHIIPREGGDGLDMLDIQGKDTPEEEIKEVREKTESILNAMLSKNLSSMGYKEGGMSKEQLIGIIENNPQLKEMIIRQPDQFKQVIPSHPQLSQMFKGADIDEIIRLVKNSRSADREKLDLAGALK